MYVEYLHHLLSLHILGSCGSLKYTCPCSMQEWEQPEYIPDPDAKMPEDWDEDTDGEWEPPMIPNPEYKVRVKTSCVYTRL